MSLLANAFETSVNKVMNDGVVFRLGAKTINLTR
jgi:hypothetical protein